MSEQGSTTSNAGTEGQTASTENTGAADKTFNQSEVDRIVSERVQRERQKYGDVDDLRKKAARLDEIEAANKSEIEKATEKVTAAERRAEEAEARLKNERTRNAVTIAASKAGFIDPADAVPFIDPADIEYDGETPKNLDKLLSSLAKSKPHLVKSESETTTTSSGSFDGGPRGSTGSTKSPGETFGDLVAEKLGR